jgi:hypothetical protein
MFRALENWNPVCAGIQTSGFLLSVGDFYALKWPIAMAEIKSD